MNCTQMEEFAREYLKYKVFLQKIPHITDDKLGPKNMHLMTFPPPASKNVKGLWKREQLTLCKALKIPNDTTVFMQRIAVFQRSLYLEVCKRVRCSLLRGQAPASALDDAPEWMRRGANVLQLLPAALKKESKAIGQEGAATSIVGAICAAWEALRQRGGAHCGGICVDSLCGACHVPCTPGCAGAGGCDECRSTALPPRAALRAAARHFRIEDTDSLLRLWLSYRSVALSKLRALTAAGDDCRRVPPAARPAPPDWRALDLTLLYDTALQLLSEESMTHHEQLQPLIILFSVVQQHGLHELEPGPARESAWRTAHSHLLARGSSISLVAMQRRWHELCAAARGRVLALRRSRAARPALPPLVQAIVRRYPEVVTRPLRPWAELVAAGHVYVEITNSELQSPLWPAPGDTTPAEPQHQDNEDDIILIEKDVEIIDLEESDGEIDELNNKNEEKKGEPDKVNNCTIAVKTLANDTDCLQRAIREEIQNHREFLRQNVVNLLDTNILNQSDETVGGSNDREDVKKASVSCPSNALVDEGLINKIVEETNRKDAVVVEKTNVTDASLENTVKCHTVDTTTAKHETVDTDNTSSLNSLDTGQQLHILNKLNPESSEAMIIFDDDEDSDEADNPSGDGIIENVVQSIKASVDLRTEESLSARSDDEKDFRGFNKVSSNIPVEIMTINEELSSKSLQLVNESSPVVTSSPQQVTETSELITECPVLVCPDIVVPFKSAEGLNINKELETESLDTKSLVVAVENSESVVSVNLSEYVNINKEIVADPEIVTDSSEQGIKKPDTQVSLISTECLKINEESAFENTKVMTESQDTIVDVTKTESQSINNEIYGKIPEQATESPAEVTEIPDTKFSVIKTENLNINNVIDAKNPELVTKCPEIATKSSELAFESSEPAVKSLELVTDSIKISTLSPVTEDLRSLTDSSILSKQETAEKPLIKDDIEAERLNINKETHSASSDTKDSGNDNLKSTESDAVQSFSVVDQNILDYKDKLKSEVVDNVEIVYNHEDSADIIKRSLISLFKENLGENIDDKSENIPKINISYVTSIETKVESEISGDLNENDKEMVVESNINVEADSSGKRNIASKVNLDVADNTSNRDTADSAAESIDPKLLMSPRIPLTRIDPPRSRILRPLLVEDFSAHPDFNVRLKALSARCLAKNRHLLKLCRPLSVHVERMSEGLLDRYLGAGRRARRVWLPDIEQVRRANRRLQCAQVAPTPLAPPAPPAPRSRQETDDIAEEVPPAAVAVENEDESMPTEEELMELLRRCEPPAPRRGSAPRHCCLARRHRAYNDARRRLAGSKLRPPPAEVDIHGAKHSPDDCECCCLHLVRGAADGALAERLQRQLRSLESRAASLLSWDSEVDGDEDNTANTIKPAGKKKRVERRKAKKPNNEEKEASSSAAQSYDGYQEWIRQKNLATKYFHISAIGDEAKQKERSLKPNTEDQKKTDVSTTATEDTNDSITVQNKYVARVFGKVNKEENAKVSQEANVESTKVMSYTSTCGQQIVKICKPADEPKKYENRKRKSLSGIPEDIPYKIRIRIPSQVSIKSLDESKKDKISSNGSHNFVEIPGKKNVNVKATTSKSSDEESIIKRNKTTSDSSKYVGPLLFVELNPLNSGMKVVGPVHSGNMTSLNDIVSDRGDNANTSSHNMITQGEKLGTTAVVDSAKGTEQLAELNDNSDDDYTDMLFIDETSRKIDRTESQKSDDINRNESTSNGNIYEQNETQYMSPVTESNIEFEKVNEAEIETSVTTCIKIEAQKPDAKKANETVAAEILPQKDNNDTNQKSEQNYKSDEELKTLPVKKVYQKMVRTKNTSESDKLVVSIKINKNTDNNLKPCTDVTKDDKELNENLKTSDTFIDTNILVSNETYTEGDSDDDVQIVESEEPPTPSLRSLLIGQIPDTKQRPPTLLEQIAQMHETGKKFVIKKVDESTPIVYHSAENFNQVSQYVELVPETNTKGAQPTLKILNQQGPGPVVNLNRQLASLCSPVVMKQPNTPQVITLKHIPQTISTTTINNQESKARTLNLSQAAQILQQNAQNESLSSGKSHLVLTVSTEGLAMATADDVANAGAAGSLQVLPRICDVTSLAPPPASANTVAVNSVSTQSERVPMATVSVRAGAPSGPGETRAAGAAAAAARAWRLSPLPPLPVQRFVQNRDPTDITVLCVDASRPLMRLAGNHLVVTEMEIPCALPTYWTVASNKKTRMLSFDPPPPAVLTPLTPLSPPPAATPDQDKQAAGNSTAVEKKGGLKVKSFAKLSEGNALAPSASAAPVAPGSAPLPPGEPAPDRVHSQGKLYKKMTDDPLIYARVLYVVSDVASCRRALAAGAAIGLRAGAGRVLRVLRAPAAGAPGAGGAGPALSTGLRCDAALPALTDLVKRLNQDTPAPAQESSAPAPDRVISLDSDDE